LLGMLLLMTRGDWRTLLLRILKEGRSSKGQSQFQLAVDKKKRKR
jgi:hypothetical protein